jgi:hypothetical protein
VFSRVSKEYGVALRAEGALKQQRVTLFLQDTDLDTFAQSLSDLLTPDPKAPVIWNRKEKSWTLTESLNRRRLIERLQNHDLDEYRRHLESEVAWLRSDDEREAKGEPREVSQGDPGTLQLIRDTRIAHARLLDWLGAEGREKLLAGEPVAVPVGSMPPALKKSYYAYLRQTLASIAGLTDDAIDRYRVAYLLTRCPTGNRFTRLVESIIIPEGYVRSRGGELRMSQATPPAFWETSFSLPPVDPTDPSRRISLTLGAAPEARPGAKVRRNLNELLEEVVVGTGIEVIADGYLRSSLQIPANFQVRNYPIGQLLDHLSRFWDCEWQFVGEGEKTVQLRARSWWLEDAADIPEPLLNELQTRLTRKKLPELTDLLKLAELSKAQLHKLIEAGYCPDAAGIVRPGVYDETGAKPLLQFFNRLSAPLQAKVQSVEGLKLGEAPPDLVNTWLRPYPK